MTTIRAMRSQPMAQRSGCVVHSGMDMVALAWTAMGLLAAAVFGMFTMLSGFGGKIDDLGSSLNARMDDLGSSLNARMDDLGSSLNARVDGLGSSLNSRIDGLSLRIDGLDSRIDHLETSLNARIDGLAVRIDAHIERHAG